MNALGDLIQQALETAGITPAEMARLAGVTPQAVNGWVRKSRISKQNLLLVAKATGRPIESFIARGDDLVKVKLATRSDAESFRRVPIVGHAIASPTNDGYFDDMGLPPGASDGFLNWPTADHSAYALRVRGDSMQPRIRPGEIIIIEPSHAIAAGDDVLVKCADGRKMVKQLLFRRRGEVTLGSINAAHQQVTLLDSEVEAMHYIAAIVPHGASLED